MIVRSNPKKKSPNLAIISDNLENYLLAVSMLPGGTEQYPEELVVMRGQFPIPKEPSSKLDREMTRWTYLQGILHLAQKDLHPKLQYEMKNILERWILTLANDNQGDTEDPIFSENKSAFRLPGKMMTEMFEKRIPNPEARINGILQLAREYLVLVTYQPSELPVIIDENMVRVGDYVRKLPPGKLEILLELNPSLEILGTMIMRYACLLVGGQQWAVPLELYRYLVQNYGVTVEAFASPINSQIIFIDPALKYCSLFPDTDRFYGSQGDFFSFDCTGQSIYVNPPYVEELLNRMAIKVTQVCQEIGDNWVRFFITVPAWTDAEYYQTLASSPFLVFRHTYLKGKHYYLNTNDGAEKITAQFNTEFFVLAVNLEDHYQEIVTFAEDWFSQNTMSPSSWRKK
jgi:hypothetical protein